MKHFNLSGWAVSHPALILFLMIVLGAAGFFSYQRLGRAEDPFFTVKVVNVTVIWPGATSAEMQTQVADPIEKKLQELPFFEKVQTYSKPSFTAMQVTFRDYTSPEDVPHLFYLLRKKLDDVQGQLPSGILGPVVNDEFSDVDSILYMMTGDGADYAELKKAAEGFRQRLMRVPGVKKVNLYGTQDERIYVEFSHAKLATLGVTPQALFDSLAKQNNVTPAGTVETSSQRVPLRVTGALDGVKAVAETPVESNGRVFRLGDIATVTHGFVDPPTFTVRQEGRPALGIGIVTTKGANILELGKDVEKATADFMKAVPQGIDVERIADQPKVVEHAVGEFVHSFIEALAIVLFVSFVALGWRTGIVVAMSVPLVLAIVFIVMNAMSLDLHRITLGALIIALGLLVDDAIIAVEMMVVKMEQGWDRIRAASFAWESTAFPDADGYAGHGSRVPAHRLRQLGGRRICRRHLLDRRDRAGRVLVRGRDLHALYRRQAAAEHRAPHPRSARDLRDAGLSRPARRGAVVRQPSYQGGGGDGRRVRRSPSSVSATCSSSFSRSRSGPNCSCSFACRKAPPSTSPRRR